MSNSNPLFAAPMASSAVTRAPPPPPPPPLALDALPEPYVLPAGAAARVAASRASPDVSPDAHTQRAYTETLCTFSTPHLHLCVHAHAPSSYRRSPAALSRPRLAVEGRDAQTCTWRGAGGPQGRSRRRPRHNGALALKAIVVVPVPVALGSGAAVVDARQRALACTLAHRARPHTARQHDSTTARQHVSTPARQHVSTSASANTRRPSAKRGLALRRAARPPHRPRGTHRTSCTCTRSSTGQAATSSARVCAPSASRSGSTTRSRPRGRPTAPTSTRHCPSEDSLGRPRLD